ncbi:MAG TPA: hypothetical protein VK892_10840, partial [Pyrinomonadaceae bacterium]|nr:hypothetical protein [Pyrinomonadaceae bacterium]
MLITELLVNEDLLRAEYNLNQADSSNIIELCRNYLSLLTEYRNELYKLRGTEEINLQQASALGRELTEQVRKAIRTAVEITTRERNQTESLLESFTSISGYEAVNTFNQLEYKGFADWELRANEVRLKNDTNNERLTVQEAVETASQ